MARASDFVSRAHSLGRGRCAPVAFVFLLMAGAAAITGAQEPVAESLAKVAIDATPIVEAPLTSGHRAHWAYSPLLRPPLPAVRQADWPRTGVDRFVRATQEKASALPAPEASRHTLLRRLSFDLTGLAPTIDEIAAFEADGAPDAYEKVVDRLLASPAFGERQAQHWLDLARFAETDGFEHDVVRKDAWRYRDWVIAALNANLPYDEFVRLQLAGDLSASAGDGVAAAPTMFCLAGPDMPDLNDQLERRHNRLNELTATVGSVFLGLQLGCAQCHDHKYDPLSQADFYRLRAVFEGAVPAFKRDVPCLTLAEQPSPQPARFWIRGDHRRPGVEVPPGFPRIACPPSGKSRGEVSQGSDSPQPLREQLAGWIVGRDNPLPARVMANRVWQSHFGRGIVETPSDFGLLGAPPSHPELLDWLAVELRDSGWNLKRLRREIVCSSTYRQDSRAAGSSAVAPEKSVDSLLARFPRRRLEGEAIRDALLAAAGLLSSERGGPGVMPPLPDEIVGTLLKGQWKASEREADHYRRSVYVFARRNLRYPLFEAFDRPDANSSCAVRPRSTTAPQALVLLNSELSLLAAQHLASRLAAAAPDDPGRIELLALITYGRRPSPAEAQRWQAFLADATAVTEPAAAADRDAWIDLCLAVINSSEFVYLD